MIYSQLFINLLVSAAIYFLTAYSFSIIYYSTKYFHIAHAAVIALGAYFVYLFSGELSIPFPISVTLAIASATFIGLACELIVYRSMQKRNAASFDYLIASIGIYIVLQNCISAFFGDGTKVINTSETQVGHQIFGAYISSIEIAIIIISISLFILVHFFLNSTSIGKTIRAVSSNAQLSNTYGVSSNKVVLIAFVIGSALAAIAGILLAMDSNMTPTFGFNLLLYGVVVMIIGGVGSTTGLLAGAFLVATSQHLSAFFLDTRWMDATTYIILIVFLIWKPLGFSGEKLRKVEI